MRKPKLLEDYSRLPNDTVPPFAHGVVRQTTASTFLAKGGDLAKPLAAALADFDAALAATDNPSPADTARRDQLRTAVVVELGRLGKRLNLDYPGQEAALLSAGLTLAAATAPAAGSAALGAGAGAVMDFDLLDGPAGYLLLKLKRPTGTTQNLIRYTPDEKLPEAQWLVAVGGGRERQLGPFAAGTRVWVKAAALTASTTEPQYSAVKSRLVQ